MENQHTPGPWTYSRPKSDSEGPVTWGHVDAEDMTHGSIATVWSDPNLCNSRLIAAAPELLAELKQVRAWMRKHLSKRLHPVMDDSDYDRIDAAIRKAEGQS